MAFRKLFASYGNLLKKYPIPTQATQTGILMGSGDLIAQHFVEKKTFSQLDLERTRLYSCMGLFVGPTVGVWYRVLEFKFGSGGLKVLLKKLSCDQLIFAPCFLGILVSTLDALKGYKIDEIKQNLKTNYTDILLTNYKIWPFVQMVNFYLVPLHFRVVLVQSVAVVWNTYLSWKINTPKPKLRIEDNLGALSRSH